MKIFHITNPFKQTQMKGNVVHFAKDVEEIHDQLPSNLRDCNNIIVVENLVDIQKISQLKIRPKLVIAALDWLIKNNHLYSNVQKIIDNLNEDEINSIVIDRSKLSNHDYSQSVANNQSSIRNLSTSSEEFIIINETSYAENSEKSHDKSFLPRLDETLEFEISEENNLSINTINSYYKPINDKYCILHSEYHQGDQIFGDAANNQCTAIAAYALMYSKFKSPSEWTKDNLNEIMLEGNDYYIYCHGIHYVNDNYDVIQYHYLSADQTLKTTKINQFEFKLTFYQDDIVSDLIYIQNQLEGLLNAINLISKLHQIEQIGCEQMIITTSDYSYAIMQEYDEYFLFDSHPKSPKGRKSPNGKASVMKFNQPNSIQNLAHYLTTLHKHQNYFAITLLKVKEQNNFNVSTLVALSLSEHQSLEAPDEIEFALDRSNQHNLIASEYSRIGIIKNFFYLNQQQIY